MNQAILEALKGSIEKWEKIVAGTGEDLGTTNCSLCLFFTDKHGSEICEDGCPVYEDTKSEGCAGTPYTEWATHHDECHHQHCKLTIECPRCKILAIKELKYLKSLLPEGA